MFCNICLYNETFVYFNFIREYFWTYIVMINMNIITKDYKIELTYKKYDDYNIGE